LERSFEARLRGWLIGEFQNMWVIDFIEWLVHGLKHPHESGPEPKEVDHIGGRDTKCLSAGGVDLRAPLIDISPGGGFASTVELNRMYAISFQVISGRFKERSLGNP
jgi:hypothetical protein